MSSVARVGKVTRTGPVIANRGLRTALRLVVVILASIFALYPFLIVIGAAFDPSGSMSGARIVPLNPSLSNFQKLLESSNAPIFRWLLNSIFVSTTATVITLILTTLAAYSFSRFRFRGRQASLLATLVIQVFPSVVALVAFYLLLLQLGENIPWLGVNQLGGLILIYCGGALGANAWLMKGYFDTIPREIDESAQVDGATHWTTFTRIVLPLIRPILAVVGLFAFIGTFNDFLLPRVLLTNPPEIKTLAVGLTTFLDNQFSTNWGLFAAGALIGCLPIIALFLVLQTQLVSGLSQGAVKG